MFLLLLWFYNMIFILFVCRSISSEVSSDLIIQVRGSRYLLHKVCYLKVEETHQVHNSLSIFLFFFLFQLYILYVAPTFRLKVYPVFDKTGVNMSVSRIIFVSGVCICVLEGTFVFTLVTYLKFILMFFSFLCCQNAYVCKDYAPNHHLIHLITK